MFIGLKISFLSTLEMTDEVIIYENDKCLSIVYLTGEVSLEDYIARYLPKNIFYLILQKDSLPNQYESLYEAWSFNATKTSVIVDMPKARNMHRDTLRQERNSRLPALDVAYIRAQERGDTVALNQIIAQKEQLRNIPAHPAIEAAQTPDDLLALTLDVLLAK